MESLKDFPKAQLSTIEFQYQTSLLDKSNIEKFEKAHEAAFWHIIYVAIYCKKLQTRHCGMQAPLLSDFEEHIETQGEEKCIFKRKGSKMQKIESFILERATRASTYHFFQ